MSGQMTEQIHLADCINKLFGNCVVYAANNVIRHCPGESNDNVPCTPKSFQAIRQ